MGTMSIKQLQSGICWVLPTFIILIALWDLGALYAADTAPSTVDQATQDKKQEPDKNAQENGEGVNIKVKVTLVTTDVTIIGKPTSELKAEDFIIYDNGVAQQVTHFSQDQLPTAIALLLDSNVMIGPFMPVIQLAGIAALRHLKPDDKVVLYSSAFGVVRRHTELTDDLVMAADVLNRIELNSENVLYDAIVDASDYLSKRAPNSRRAIILISNNHSNWSNNKTNPDRALNSLLETSTTLYSVLVPSSNLLKYPVPMGEGYISAALLIPKMVEETGGDLFDVSDPAALANAMLNIPGQYTLGFSPSNPGKARTYHRLEIKLASGNHCPGCIIRSRKGYYTESAAPTVQPSVIKKSVRTPEKTDELLVEQAIRSAASFDWQFNSLPLRVQTTATTDANGKPAIKIDLQIPAKGIGFKIEEGLHAFKLRIAIFSSIENTFLGSDWRVVEGRLSDETYNKYLRSGIPFSTTIPKKALSRWRMKIVVYDEGNDRVGSTTITSIY
jgi:Ca-activated chloride channel homolog